LESLRWRPFCRRLPGRGVADRCFEKPDAVGTRGWGVVGIRTPELAHFIVTPTFAKGHQVIAYAIQAVGFTNY
jgi:hypothetical protein